MKNKEKVINTILGIDYVIAMTALLVLITITFFGVIMRYFFGNPFVWQEEVQLWCFVWIVFFGASAAFRSGGHVAIDVVVDMFPEKVKKVIEIFGYIIVMGVLIYLCQKGMVLVKQLGTSGRVTNILKVPYPIIYGAMPIGCVLMMISNTLMTAKSLFGKNEDGEGQE